MNSMIWCLLVFKLFFICWLIYFLLERRKRRIPQQSLAVTEQGMITSYAGAPVTQIPKDYNAYYQPQPAATNMMPSNLHQPVFLNHQPNVMGKS